MKKLISLVMICILSLLPVSAAYGNETKEYNSIVTSGLDFGKEKISTFDSSRTVSGSAQKDSFITIEVYTEHGEELSLCSSYDISVGVSGIFAQLIEFELGKNYIVVTDHNSGNTEEIIVNRKSMEIKKVLEKGIYLP